MISMRPNSFTVTSGEPGEEKHECHVSLIGLDAWFVFAAEPPCHQLQNHPFLTLAAAYSAVVQTITEAEKGPNDAEN